MRPPLSSWCCTASSTPSSSQHIHGCRHRRPPTLAVHPVQGASTKLTMRVQHAEAPRHACICTCATATSLATRPTAFVGLFINNIWSSTTSLATPPTASGGLFVNNTWSSTTSLATPPTASGGPFINNTWSSDTFLATPPTASGILFINNTWGNSTPLKHLYHRWHSGQHLSLQSSTPPTSFWRVLLHQHHRGDNAPHSSPPRWRSGVVFFIDSTEGNSVPLFSSPLMAF